MTGEIRTWVGSQACDTLKKRHRKARQSRRGHGHIPVAYPTKKVTRDRMRAAGTLPVDHRRFTLRQLIKKAGSSA